MSTETGPIAEGSYEWYRREVERLQAELASLRTDETDVDWLADHVRTAVHHVLGRIDPRLDSKARDEAAEQAAIHIRAGSVPFVNARVMDLAIDSIKQVRTERDALRAELAEVKHELRTEETEASLQVTRFAGRAERAEAERDALKAELAEARATIERLSYERRLLGWARMTLDLVAAGGPERQEQARREAEDVAQRIVDEIGHPVTDEPALGPGFRAAIERTRDALERYAKAGCSTVNVRQVISLLSPTWPDGNYEAALDTPQRPEDTRPVKHIGGNAEDCPACDTSTMPYPWICPGEPEDTREKTATRLIRCDRHAKTWSGNHEVFQDCRDCREEPVTPVDTREETGR